jgi:hypothetical protein
MSGQDKAVAAAMTLVEKLAQRLAQGARRLHLKQGLTP